MSNLERQTRGFCTGGWTQWGSEHQKADSEKKKKKIEKEKGNLGKELEGTNCNLSKWESRDLKWLLQWWEGCSATCGHLRTWIWSSDTQNSVQLSSRFCSVFILFSWFIARKDHEKLRRPGCLIVLSDQRQHLEKTSHITKSSHQPS